MGWLDFALEKTPGFCRMAGAMKNDRTSIFTRPGPHREVRARRTHPNTCWSFGAWDQSDPI